MCVCVCVWRGEESRKKRYLTKRGYQSVTYLSNNPNITTEGRFICRCWMQIILTFFVKLKESIWEIKTEKLLILTTLLHVKIGAIIMACQSAF